MLSQVEKESLYMAEPWFECRDEDIRCMTRSMVTTRKPRSCACNGAGPAHEMPAGSRMLVERAIYEGAWASWALCTRCMDEWLRKTGQLPEEQEAKP